MGYVLPMKREVDALKKELAQAKTEILTLQIRLKNAELLYANEVQKSAAKVFSSAKVDINLAG